MSKSHRTILLVVGILALAMVACKSTAPSATAPAPVATQAGPQTTPAPANTESSTAVPVPTSTLVSTPTASPTITPTTRAQAPVVKPTVQAAKLDFTLDDIEYAPSAKRKGDNKIQMTVTLRPKGGMAPFKMIVDGVTYEGLTHTFDWHNCDETEPHDFTVISADGQQSDKVSVLLPYHC